MRICACTFMAGIMWQLYLQCSLLAVIPASIGPLQLV